jgi:c-di-GMP-binding flagellar brake protein YcgR
MIPYQERRQYPRVSLTHVTVEVYDSAGRPDKPEFCFIINVSENGMLFKSNIQTEEYEKNMVVRITFTLPENNIVIRTDALIIHVQNTDISQYIGVQFKNIGDAEQNYLRDFVLQSLNNDNGMLKEIIDG